MPKGGLLHGQLCGDIDTFQTAKVEKVFLVTTGREDMTRILCQQLNKEENKKLLPTTETLASQLET